MKRVTITPPDDLEAALDRYREPQGLPSDSAAAVLALVREHLTSRGYLVPRLKRPLRITSAEHGSGLTDVGVNHDRYLYEDPE